MWQISVALLLLIAFALILSSRIAKNRRMRWIFLSLAFAVLLVVMFWFLPSPIHRSALGGFVFLSGAVSDLIARPILIRRLTPPCVSVRPTRIYKTVSAFFWIVMIIASGILFFVTESLSLLTMMLPWVLGMIIQLILNLSERVEMCGAGVCQHGWLRPWDGHVLGPRDEYVPIPWDKYESFYWKGKTKDSFKLWLVSKSWGSDRLLVAPEDREAVQQILEANLPDSSSSSEGRNT